MTREGWQLGDIEPFLINEAYLLDTRQFETWMSLFTDDGYYWAPADAEQESPEHQDSHHDLASHLRPPGHDIFDQDDKSHMSSFRTRFDMPSVRLTGQK